VLGNIEKIERARGKGLLVDVYMRDFRKILEFRVIIDRVGGSMGRWVQLLYIVIDNKLLNF